MVFFYAKLPLQLIFTFSLGAGLLTPLLLSVIIITQNNFTSPYGDAPAENFAITKSQSNINQALFPFPAPSLEL